MPSFFLADRAHLGAEYLDTVRPGWAQEIDLDVLDMYTSDHCVLGQLYFDYTTATKSLGLSFEQIRDFGFYIPLTDIDIVLEMEVGMFPARLMHYSELTREWRYLVQDRLPQAA